MKEILWFMVKGSSFKAGANALAFFLFCLTDYTDGTDYACLAASGISLLVPQKAKAKYRKKQKQSTAKSKSKMPQKTKINFVDSNIISTFALEK